MAVPKEYEIVNVNGLRGLRANKDFTKFYYRFKTVGKEYTFVLDYSKKTWTPKVRKDNARKEAETYKEQKRIELENPFNPDTPLNYIAKEYFTKKCTSKELSKDELKHIKESKLSDEEKEKLLFTDWTKARKRLYELYIEPFIGKKKVSRIIENDIDTIRHSMENTGHSKQNENGNSTRSIEKVLIQTLKPILKYAESNGALNKIPTINIPNKKKNKKEVKDGTQKLSLLYNVIQKRYKDDPFYRALFLFALFGRRWNEIASLKWSDIDFANNRYTIQAENNKIGNDQTYDLPEPIKEPLLKLQDNQGLIFKSPITGKKLHPPRKQLAKIQEDANMPELTMHYFRHILVTALGESGTAATVLSASLGHTRADTVDKHYRSINHLKGSQDANKQLENIIDIEVVK
ncbi:MAG: tyrosine-type recombinase/integrase [Bacteroidia bacterium]|nr:tyrosine-type recombinase/integrase [Bacteroidia bacterium]